MVHHLFFFFTILYSTGHFFTAKSAKYCAKSRREEDLYFTVTLRSLRLSLRSLRLIFILSGSVILLFLYTTFSLFSQQVSKPSPTAFSLKEAIDHALLHNSTYQNVLLDEQLAGMKKNEVRGMGFPQLSSSFDIKDFEKLPTQLLPGQFFGGPA